MTNRRQVLRWVTLFGSGMAASLAAATSTKASRSRYGERRSSPADDDGRRQRQDASDSDAVTDVILRERLAREIGDWAGEAACFHPDASIEVSWFKGSGAQFVEAAKSDRDKDTVHFDSMSPGVVTVDHDRAIADTACAVHTFSRLYGIDVSTTSYTRLLWRVQRSGAEWLIVGLRGIYIRDTLTPCDPGKMPMLDEQKLRSFRPSYRYLSYVLTASGSTAHDDLPGVDRPETVAALRAGEREWLQRG